MSEKIDKNDKKNSKDKEDENVISSSLVQSLEINLYAVVGTRRMTVGQVARLKPGAIVQFDKFPKGSLVDLCANNKVCAKAELISNEEGLGVKVVEIIDD